MRDSADSDLSVKTHDGAIKAAPTATALKGCFHFNASLIWHSEGSQFFITLTWDTLARSSAEKRKKKKNEIIKLKARLELLFYF